MRALPRWEVPRSPSVTEKILTENMNYLGFPILVCAYLTSVSTHEVDTYDFLMPNVWPHRVSTISFNLLYCLAIKPVKLFAVKRQQFHYNTKVFWINIEVYVNPFTILSRSNLKAPDFIEKIKWTVCSILKREGSYFFHISCVANWFSLTSQVLIIFITIAFEH